MAFPRPRVVFSRCLGFEACRYNGQIIASEAVEQFRRFFDCVTVCPEADIGLGIPRDPIRIVRRDEGLRLVQPSTGRDVSDEMLGFAADFLDNLGKPGTAPGRQDAAAIRYSPGFLGPVDGFVLKSRSPSCGLTDVKLFGETSKGSALPGKIAGFFGGEVLQRFPLVAVEDEGRLTNFTIREHFLTRVYVSARFRQLRERPTMAGLVRFQAENKLLFMAYNQTRMRELGRIVANQDRLPVADAFERYARTLPLVFAKQPRFNSAVNVLQHGAGYFKDKVSAREKGLLAESLESYRAGRVPLSVPQSIIRAWVARFDVPYLEQQTFFRPYPEELQFISDSGKGRKTS
jgi:uncharacterized protein YbgA (DUF1722 family)/uncharacterized protein YbbK (DUF523 family)